MNNFSRRALVLIVVCFFLLLLLPAAQAIARNTLFVLANKAYTTPKNQQQQLARVNQLMYKIGSCANLDVMDATAVIIQNFDNCYVNHPPPLQTITQTIQLPAHILAEGSSRPGESSGDVVTLFGGGDVRSRLFFLSEESDSWVISVHAKHDAPAPIILEIWLDTRYIGQLVFDKGDDSWETLSLAVPIEPGFHNLYLRYVNDFFDPEQGLDRNAYIEYVQITR